MLRGVCSFERSAGCSFPTRRKVVVVLLLEVRRASWRPDFPVFRSELFANPISGLFDSSDQSPTALEIIFFVENGRVPKTTFLALRCEGFLRCNILLHINSNHGEIHF
jgi:hypothetical protein